jgi:hypothetical protein
MTATASFATGSLDRTLAAIPLGAAADAHRDLEARRTSGQILLLA